VLNLANNHFGFFLDTLSITLSRASPDPKFYIATKQDQHNNRIVNDETVEDAE